MWEIGWWFPQKEDADVRYIVTSLLYLGAKPSCVEVKKKVIDNEISSCFKIMREIGNDVKSRCAARIMHTYHVNSLIELSNPIVFKRFCEMVDIELRNHENFQKNYREFKERIARVFTIKADIAYATNVDIGLKDINLFFALHIILEGGSCLFESSTAFWDKLVYYFSKFDPPIFFVKNFPPE